MSRELAAAFAVFMDADSTQATRDALIEKLSRAEREQLASMLIAKENEVRLGREDLEMKLQLLAPHMTDDDTTVEQAAARIPCRRAARKHEHRG